MPNSTTLRRRRDSLAATLLILTLAALFTIPATRTYTTSDAATIWTVLRAPFIALIHLLATLPHLI